MISRSFSWDPVKLNRVSFVKKMINSRKRNSGRKRSEERKRRKSDFLLMNPELRPNLSFREVDTAPYFNNSYFGFPSYERPLAHYFETSKIMKKYQLYPRLKLSRHYLLCNLYQRKKSKNAKKYNESDKKYKRSCARANGACKNFFKNVYKHGDQVSKPELFSSSFSQGNYRIRSPHNSSKFFYPRARLRPLFSLSPKALGNDVSLSTSTFTYRDNPENRGLSLGRNRHYEINDTKKNTFNDAYINFSSKNGVIKAKQLLEEVEGILREPSLKLEESQSRKDAIYPSENRNNTDEFVQSLKIRIDSIVIPMLTEISRNLSEIVQQDRKMNQSSIGAETISVKNSTIEATNTTVENKIVKDKIKSSFEKSKSTDKTKKGNSHSKQMKTPGKCIGNGKYLNI